MQTISLTECGGYVTDSALLHICTNLYNQVPTYVRITSNFDKSNRVGSIGVVSSKLPDVQDGSLKPPLGYIITTATSKDPSNPFSGLAYYERLKKNPLNSIIESTNCTSHNGVPYTEYTFKAIHPNPCVVGIRFGNSTKNIPVRNLQILVDYEGPIVMICEKMDLGKVTEDFMCNSISVGDFVVGIRFGRIHNKTTLRFCSVEKLCAKNVLVKCCMTGETFYIGYSQVFKPPYPHPMYDQYLQQKISK